MRWFRCYDCGIDMAGQEAVAHADETSHNVDVCEEVAADHRDLPDRQVKYGLALYGVLEKRRQREVTE